MSTHTAGGSNAAESKAPLLAVSNLTVRYYTNGPASVEALRSVSFELPPGEMLVVVGPNGSGKSTLLHAIAGNLQAQITGDIRFAGKTVLAQPMHRRARRLAIVHQDPTRGTAAHLTLREHCALTAAGDGRRPVEWKDVQDGLAAIGTRLDPNRLAGELSGGQRQLFAVVLAVLGAPRLLLLDEPTSALDTRHSALVVEVIEEFAGRHDAGAVLITHDLAEALRLGSRLLVLNAKGEAHALIEGTPKTSLTDATLRELLTGATSAAWTH